MKDELYSSKNIKKINFHTWNKLPKSNNSLPLPVKATKVELLPNTKSKPQKTPKTKKVTTEKLITVKQAQIENHKISQSYKKERKPHNNNGCNI